MERLSVEAMEYIVARLVKNAQEAHEDLINDGKDLFNEGRNLAYYEMLDIIKNELEARDIDVSKFGIDFDIDDLINTQK